MRGHETLGKHTIFVYNKKKDLLNQQARFVYRQRATGKYLVRYQKMYRKVQCVNGIWRLYL